MKKQPEKNVSITEKEVIIKIKYTERTKAVHPRLIFEEDIFDFIPEEMRGRVKLISKPDRVVSNMSNKQKFSNEGTWKFAIMPKKKNTQTSPRRVRKKKVDKEV